MSMGILIENLIHLSHAFILNDTPHPPLNNLMIKYKHNANKIFFVRK